MFDRKTARVELAPCPRCGKGEIVKGALGSCLACSREYAKFYKEFKTLEKEIPELQNHLAGIQQRINNKSATADEVREFQEEKPRLEKMIQQKEQLTKILAAFPKGTALPQPRF